MLNLYHTDTFQQCLTRIDDLHPDSLPLWGEMSVAQMLAHCNEVLEVYNGRKFLRTNFLTRLFKGAIKRVVIGPEPYKKNSPTSAQFKITESKDFDEEKAKLIQALTFFHNMDKDKARDLKHLLFGAMTLEERGWAMYKHLDHHLDQFGV